MKENDSSSKSGLRHQLRHLGHTLLALADAELPAVEHVESEAVIEAVAEDLSRHLDVPQSEVSRWFRARLANHAPPTPQPRLERALRAVSYGYHRDDQGFLRVIEIVRGESSVKKVTISAQLDRSELPQVVRDALQRSSEPVFFDVFPMSTEE